MTSATRFAACAGAANASSSAAKLQSRAVLNDRDLIAVPPPGVAARSHALPLIVGGAGGPVQVFDGAMPARRAALCLGPGLPSESPAGPTVDRQNFGICSKTLSFLGLSGGRHIDFGHFDLMFRRD